jgi:Saxitoxin biosynthesis operon protein SxtJ
MLPINRNPSVRELNRFCRLWLPLFVLAAGGFGWWQLESPVTALGVWAIGVVLVAIGLSSPEHGRTLFVGLQTITYPIGLVVSTIALLTLFYAVFTPLGWAMRLIGRDPLRLRARAQPSNWVPHHDDHSAERAFRQY